MWGNEEDLNEYGDIIIKVTRKYIKAHFKYTHGMGVYDLCEFVSILAKEINREFNGYGVIPIKSFDKKLEKSLKR